MANLTINTAFNLHLEFVCAPFGKRVLALVIDTILTVAYIYIIGQMISAMRIGSDSNIIDVMFLLLCSPIYFYHFMCEVLLNGASLGKKITKLHVISADGTKPTITQYFMRWMCNPSGFILIGLALIIYSGGFTAIVFGLLYLVDFFCVLLHKHGQRLGDIAAGTVVVSKTQPYSLYDTIYVEVDNKNYVVTYPAVIKLSDRDINTINNVLTQHSKYHIVDYVQTLAAKVEKVLAIESKQVPSEFLRTLLDDYNYLSQKT